MVIKDKYIVIFKDSSISANSIESERTSKGDKAKQVASTLLKKKGISAKIEFGYGDSVKGFSAFMTTDQAEKLRNDDQVELIEQDIVVTLSITTGSNEAPYGVKRVGSSSAIGKTAWVIDTGVDLTHPDLIVDTNKSMSVFTRGRDKSPNDFNGHGTHVAGTIGAKSNGVGVVGVAHDCTIVAIKVLDSKGSGSYSGVIKGIDYVAANAKPGDVANMSLGGPVSTILDNAVINAAKKGILFVVAAGNEGSDAINYSPSRIVATNVFTVSAMDINDNFASFSNFGNSVKYCAPGVNINSTWINGGYKSISGTSMAAPHVAGVLLVTNGDIKTDGFVKNDPDGKADPIAHI
jgi:subtilisin family serine protease